MDLPQLLHHHTQNPSTSRSVPVSVSNLSRPQHTDEPRPQFPSPNHSSESHSRFQTYQFHPQNHHLHQQRNAPPQMKPQTPPFQASAPHHQQLLPLRGYSSVQSEIGFVNSGCGRGFADDPAPRSSFAHPDASHQVNVSNRRFVADGERPRNRLPEFEMEGRPYDQPRAMAVNQSLRQHQPLSPYKMNGRLRHETDTSSRFKLECGELIRGHDHGGFARRGNLVASPGKSFRDLEFVSVSGLSNRESESESYNGRYEKESFRNVRQDGGFENQGWVNERKVQRVVHNPSFGRGSSQINNDYSNGNGSHFVSGKLEYRGPQSGNFVRANREGSYEHNRIPRKQFQKKSALLRLHKPNHRNAENAQFHYNGNHDNSNSSFYRHRDQYMHTDSEMEVQENPVELDVSFKSNSLVAKAVATPTSASDNISSDLAPTALKGSDKLVSNMECSNAESIQLSVSPMNVDSAPCTANTDSTGDKERVESAEKVNSDVLVTCELGLLNVNSSVDNQRLEKNVEQRKVVADVGSSKPPIKVVKKKKVVKKIVKKVLRPRSLVLGSEQKKHQQETQKHDASSSYSFSIDANNLESKVDIDGLRMRGERQRQSIDFTNCLVNSQKNEHGFSIQEASSMQEQVKADNSSEDAESSSKLLLVMTNNDSELVNPSHAIVPPIIANPVIGDSLIVDNSLEAALLPIKLPRSENVDHPLLNSECTKMYDSVTSALHPANFTDRTLDAVHGTKSSEEEISVQEEILKTAAARSNLKCNPIDDCTLKDKKHRADENASYTEESNANEDFRRKKIIRNELGFSRASEDDGLDSTAVLKTNTAVVKTLKFSSESRSNEVAASSLGGLVDKISEPTFIATDSIDFDVTSIPCSKRRKVSASQSPSQTNDKTVDATTSCSKPQLTSNEVPEGIPMDCDNGINDLQDEKRDCIVEFVSEEHGTSREETRYNSPSGQEVEPLSIDTASANCPIQNSYLNFIDNVLSPDDRHRKTIEASNSVPDLLSTKRCLQTLLSVSDSNPADASSVGKTSRKISMQNTKFNPRSQNSISAISKTCLVSDCTSASDHIVKGNASLPHQDPERMLKGEGSSDVEYNGLKKQRGSNVSRTFPLIKPFTLKKKPTAANARTWHRNISSSISSLPGSNPIPSTSYVRKGNSLVRNPSPAVAVSQSSGSGLVHRLSSPSLDESKKKPCEFTPSPLAGSLSKSVPASPSELSDTPTMSEGSPASENRHDQWNNPDVQIELNYSNSTSLNPKKIVYVKPKSNQLVATSNSVDPPLASGNSQSSSFDSYYKKRKNQLIRTSVESGIGQLACMSGQKAGGQMTINSDSGMRLSKRRSQKVFTKMFKRSAKSLVWTLRSSQSREKDSGLSNQLKVFSHLFPWKRTAYWRSAMHNLNMVSKSRSSNAISNLLLSRRRDTVYTRSINGFSLRKSKVLSVGGSSLKWSKSIETHSKKVNEEATLAVAAVEKKKREQKGAMCISSGPKSRNHSSRERIFRIGLFRYKMDPSRRSLQRISDDELSCEPANRPDKGAMSSYIPRRLVIGYNEYIRIGNGNKLIRDPKKRSRALASEKVRWSLLTARLRLVKKKTYCQFFTRFGRCNKDSGRCPYLHDPSKIAVCTKYLNGSCSTNNCKLTHKVIPERMPDCSYFLQGLCSNPNCHYRHVSVNPKASACEAFLRGYCADGDECRKKHSYVCPAFEATGTCSDGLKCRLHHPKKRSKGKKRKQPRELKNLHGRYFGSPDNVLPERETPEKLLTQEERNNASLMEECADYIALDISDEDDDYTGERNNRKMTRLGSDFSSDSEELEDLDDIIKPVLLMNRNLTT